MSNLELKLIYQLKLTIILLFNLANLRDFRRGRNIEFLSETIWIWSIKKYERKKSKKCFICIPLSQLWVSLVQLAQALHKVIFWVLCSSTHLLKYQLILFSLIKKEKSRSLPFLLRLQKMRQQLKKATLPRPLPPQVPLAATASQDILMCTEKTKS